MGLYKSVRIKPPKRLILSHYRVKEWREGRKDGRSKQVDLRVVHDLPKFGLYHEDNTDPKLAVPENGLEEAET